MNLKKLLGTLIPSYRRAQLLFFWVGVALLVSAAVTIFIGSQRAGNSHVNYLRIVWGPCVAFGLALISWLLAKSEEG